MNTFERLDHKKLNKVVRRVRNRWRARVALRGIAVVLIAGFLALLALTWGLDTLRYRPWALFAFSAATYAGLLALILRFIVMPLSSKVTDDRVALYIGEQSDGMRAELISAIEMADFDNRADADKSVSPAFAREVVQQAVYHLHDIDYGRRVETGKLRRFSTILASAVAFVMLMAIMSPAFLRTGAPLLFMPWARTAFANPYAIELTPGDVQIARGADQLITAGLVGFDSDRVEIAVRSAGGDWERWPMTDEEGSGEYVFLVFDVGADTEYFVESAGVRSGVFNIEVVDLPYVETMALEYHFPEYSGLEPQVIEDGGDIAVLMGTEVRVAVSPTVEVSGGRLMITWDDSTDAQEIPLSVGEDGRLQGSFAVGGPGSYRVELQGFGGAMNAASPDYFIDSLDDQPPRVAFETPGRDTQVSPLDEAFVEVVAEDDFGITALELVYSVNGGEEVSVPLFRPSGGDALSVDVSAGYTFYIEEEELQPGDFISYYARGYDNHGESGQDATTDIFFMEVRPLDRTFRQSQQGGGGGGGGGGGQQEDTAFARRQRQIVSATFRLIRDRDSIEDTQYDSDLGTLAVNQSRLREQVELVLGRTSQRGSAMPGSDFDQMAEHLRNAVSEMVPAEEELGRLDADAALPPEQRALQHLQRAEALMRDVQVSFQQGGGGGGGGGQQQDSLNEDLADLLDLEMEKLRNQYEQVQRGQQQAQDEQVDEALQRLEELARRQQQENERQRRLAGLPQNQGGGGGGGQQRQLADEAEELARELERLARENQDQEMQELSRRMQEAADSMRRAAAGNNDRALAEGLNALNTLQQARSDLQGEQSRRLQRDLEDVQNRVDQLQQQQETIADDVQQIGADAAGGGDRQRLIEQMERVLERKDELAAELADLEDQVETMARESRRDEREAARKLQETSNWMRDSKLADKVRYSKGVAQQRLGPYAEQFEEQITNDLDRLGEMIDDAQGLVEGPQENELSSALDDTRDLVRGLESLAERYDQGLDRQGQQGEQGEGQQGQQGEGQQGQQGEGQQGQQGEGQQGQQGEGQQGQQGEGQQGEGQQGQQGQGQQGQQGQGQQGQQGEGQQGENRGGGGRLGDRNADGRFGGGAWGDWDDQQRQFGAEYNRRVQEAEALRDRLREEGQQVTDLDRILDEMRDWEFDGTPRGIDELRDQVIEDLKLFEYTLRRIVDGGAGPRPALADSDEVPEGYRQQVEEYFRALSRGSGSGGGR